MPTKTRAAIVRDQPTGGWEVVDVTLDDPRQGEIRIKMAVSGLCHSDYHLLTGDSVPYHLPMVGGHEGTGVVEEVGPNTPGWEVGDKVVFSFISSCGKCRWCAEGMQNLCQNGAYLMRGSRFDDLDSYRFTLDDGTPVGQMCGIGSFAEHTVVSVDSAVKLPADADLDKVWLLGCGVGTGWGSAVYLAETKPGDCIIVMGVGGVGIHAVQGAKHAGATWILAVDPVELKRQKALEAGATHVYATIEEAAEFAKTVTNWQGADKAIITIGVPTGQDVADAFYAIRKAGTVVLTGITPETETSIPIKPLDLTRFQKTIKGGIYGGSNPNADIIRQYNMYEANQLKLDEFVSGLYSLDDINRGYDDLLAGKNVRGGVSHHH